MMKSFLVSKATVAGTVVQGILLSGEVDGFKDIFIFAVCFFGGLTALKGLATLSEGQGENNAASKTQGWGFLGGGVAFIIIGILIVDYLFGLV